METVEAMMRNRLTALIQATSAAASSSVQAKQNAAAQKAYERLQTNYDQLQQNHDALVQKHTHLRRRVQTLEQEKAYLLFRCEFTRYRMNALSLQCQSSGTGSIATDGGHPANDKNNQIPTERSVVGENSTTVTTTPDHHGAVVHPCYGNFRDDNKNKNKNNNNVDARQSAQTVSTIHVDTADDCTPLLSNVQPTTVNSHGNTTSPPDAGAPTLDSARGTGTDSAESETAPPFDNHFLSCNDKKRKTVDISEEHHHCQLNDGPSDATKGMHERMKKRRPEEGWSMHGGPTRSEQATSMQEDASSPSSPPSRITVYRSSVKGSPKSMEIEKRVQVPLDDATHLTFGLETRDCVKIFDSTLESNVEKQHAEPCYTYIHTTTATKENGPSALLAADEIGRVGDGHGGNEHFGDLDIGEPGSESKSQDAENEFEEEEFNEYEDVLVI